MNYKKRTYKKRTYEKKNWSVPGTVYTMNHLSSNFNSCPVGGNRPNSKKRRKLPEPLVIYSELFIYEGTERIVRHTILLQFIIIFCFFAHRLFGKVCSMDANIVTKKSSTIVCRFVKNFTDMSPAQVAKCWGDIPEIRQSLESDQPVTLKIIFFRPPPFGGHIFSPLGSGALGNQNGRKYNWLPLQIKCLNRSCLKP